jgi:RND family efflux transporter MFP subunit
MICRNIAHWGTKGFSVMRPSAALLSILALLLLFSCSSGKRSDREEERAIPVRVGEVRHIQDHELVSVSGTVVSPDAPAEVSFQVSGKVVKVGPREGENVQKGQFLAAIDPTDYTLAVQAASAQARQAGVAFERARDEYGRMKFLYESRSLPENDFRKFKAAWLGAAANEKLARKHLADASLYAPTSGFISRRSIEPGDTAGAGRPVFEIVKLDPAEINVGVPETDIHLVRVGRPAAITVPALPGESFQGTVRVINVSADPATRTYMTRIAVPNPGHILLIGMVAEAQIQGERMVDMVTLPAEAIMRDPQGATVVFVYYPDQQRVYSRRVQTGTVHGREIVIKGGLSGNESIVLAGQEKLRDGAKVSVTDENGPGAKEGRQ